MDIILICFNDVGGLVETKYFNSGFLKRQNSNDLHDNLLQSLSTIDLGKMIQITMDGANVNWDLLKILSKYREENELPELVNIGSCGLHVMHGSLRTGMMETDREIHKTF